MVNRGRVTELVFHRISSEILAKLLRCWKKEHHAAQTPLNLFTKINCGAQLHPASYPGPADPP